MVSVVHRTPGLIPIEAFTIAGLSAKPNSLNPIGKFGTGLKYAIAVLVRMDIKVTVFIGHTEYVFYKTKRQFRGKDYFAIRMKKRSGLMAKWTYHELPFTTEYGKYWELWQVFRELHANTLDEGGETFKVNEGYHAPDADHTHFVIEDSRYVDVFHERDRIFLPDGAKVRSDSEAIQVLDRPSKHIYFRGMRIMDLRHEAMFTYNFLEDVDLTEDRTAKYPQLLESRIVGYMQESEDTSFVEKVVAKPKEESFESRLNHSVGYSYGWAPARISSSYKAAAAKSTNVTAKEVWNQQQPSVPASCLISIKIPKPELSANEIELIVSTTKAIHAGSEVSINGQTVMAPEEVMF